MTAERYCGAKKRQGEGDCRRPAGWGTSHPGIGRCKLHGGSTPDQTTKAKRDRAAQLVATYGGRVDIAPGDALDELIGRAFGHMLSCAALIASAPDLEHVDRFVLERYDIERALLGRLTRDAIGAGIAERQVRLAEEQGRQLANVLRDVLGDVFGLLTEAGLSIDVLVRIQREAVPALVRRRLSEVMEVSGG